MVVTQSGQSGIAASVAEGRDDALAVGCGVVTFEAPVWPELSVDEELHVTTAMASTRVSAVRFIDLNRILVIPSLCPPSWLAAGGNSIESQIDQPQVLLP